MSISENLKARVQKYAELSVRKGLNVQPGQTITIYSMVETDAVEFARMQAAAAYQAGAALVNIEWRDTPTSRLFLENASDEEITNIPDWVEQKWAYLIKERHTSRLSTIGEDPDGMQGVDPKKQAARRKANSAKTKFVMEATMKDDISWLVNAAPTQKWAEKVFPDLKGQAAVAALWEAILKTVYVTEDNDPIQTWDAHTQKLQERADWLNNHNFKALRYHSEKSDFTIGLAEGHIWEAASSTDAAGNAFIANLPTEEVFTAPDRRHLDGHVAATKPLNYQGTLITDIEIDLKDGQIVNAKASNGQEVLEGIIATDAGSRSLGEVSLVPHSSPISQSNLIWYETLFDENASDHLAIGAAYASNIKDGKTADEATLQARGWNVSDVHVDFMVGSADMNVDGITYEDEAIPVMRNGEWV